MNVGRSVIARISATTISTLSVPIPVDIDRDALAPVRARDRHELPVPMLELDAVEAGGDAVGPVRVAGEEDVLGQFARAESDVVLPLAGRERDAGVRVRQGFSLSCPRFHEARNPPEDSPRLLASVKHGRA